MTDSKRLQLLYWAIEDAGGPARANQEHDDLFLLRTINWLLKPSPMPSNPPTGAMSSDCCGAGECKITTHP